MLLAVVFFYGRTNVKTASVSIVLLLVVLYTIVLYTIVLCTVVLYTLQCPEHFLELTAREKVEVRLQRRVLLLELFVFLYEFREPIDEVGVLFV